MSVDTISKNTIELNLGLTCMLSAWTEWLRYYSCHTFSSKLHNEILIYSISLREKVFPTLLLFMKSLYLNVIAFLITLDHLSYFAFIKGKVTFYQPANVRLNIYQSSIIVAFLLYICRIYVYVGFFLLVRLAIWNLLPYLAQCNRNFTPVKWN